MPKDQMTLSQTRQALIEEFEEASTGSNIVEVFEYQIQQDPRKWLTQALNDYTEEILRIVEGMKEKGKFEYGLEESAYNQALNDIREALNDTK